MSSCGNFMWRMLTLCCSVLVISRLVSALPKYSQPISAKSISAKPISDLPFKHVYPQLPIYQLYSPIPKKTFEGAGYYTCKGDNKGLYYSSVPKYIPPRLVCDGHNDCQHGDDEHGCLEKPEIPLTDFSICHGKYLCEVKLINGAVYPICIGDRHVCDDHIDCPNGIDEHGCPPVLQTPAPTPAPLPPAPVTLPSFYACTNRQFTNAQLQGPDGDPIVFADVGTNVGGGYNENTGQFVAPIDGVYQFDWSYLINRDGSLWTELRVDDVLYAKAASFAESGQYEQVQRSLQLDLMAGQTVTIAYHHGTGSIYGQEGRYTCFQGTFLPQTV